MTVFFLALTVAFWTYRNFGLIPSIVAAMSLVLNPLVFSEAHFNVKDPILMSFFGLAILSFWYGFSRSKSPYILLSAILAGLALGTKFNTLFLPIILAPWVLFILIQRLQNKKSNQFGLLNLIGGSRMLVSILAYPFIVLGILYIFSPYLWIDPIGHFMEIVNYYKSIGKEPLTPEMSRFLVAGWNTYPLVWILYTTPLPILVLFLTGLLRSVFLSFKKDNISVLILLWFLVPIIRVMWPGANIYGGVRQIMEFIPAMAILSGIGTLYLVKKGGRLTSILIITSFLLVALELISIHPNENVYFNLLINGLQGAKKFNMPSWGNSYGNVYLQGIKWLNENVEPNAKLALPINYISAIPRFKLRSDIDLDNYHFSGLNRDKEYAMEMDFDWPLRSRYKYSYYEIFLDPVYQVSVNGVPILKIWKNDLEHTKKGFEKEILVKPLSIRNKEQKIIVDFAQEISITKLIINHSNVDCDDKLGEGFIAISRDGINFVQEPNLLYDPESPESSPGMDENTFVYLFPAKPAVSLIFNSKQPNSCILKDYNVQVWGLAKSP